jgi:hypothetical protein
MASKSDVTSGGSYERGSTYEKKVSVNEKDGTPRLTISFLGEFSQGYMKDIRMHEGISVNFRVEDIDVDGCVDQNNGSPADGNK